MPGHDRASEEKANVDHAEKAYDAVPVVTDVNLDSDWTPEEEKAVVYVSSTRKLVVT
jgi:hypothetical protein